MGLAKTGNQILNAIGDGALSGAKGLFGKAKGAVVSGGRKVKGLLGGGVKYGAPGLGVLSLNKNLNDIEDSIEGMGAGGSGGGVFGGGGGGAGMVNSAAATSALSDADSSDPVVRQLQDIERVLVSIKGDTATIGSMMNKPVANNGNAARGMFAGSGDKPVGDLRSFAGLGAGVGALFLAGKGDTTDRNADGIPDSEQDKAQTSIDKEAQDLLMKPKTTKTAGVLAAKAGAKIASSKTGQAIGKAGVRVATSAVESTREAVAKATGRGATAAAATIDSGPKSNVTPITKDIDMNGKPVAQPAAAGAAGGPKTITPPVDLAAAANDAPGSNKGKIAKAITKRISSVAAKAVPLLGALVSGGFAIEKLFARDFRGAMMEAGSIFLPSVSGTALDIATAARDVYMDVHDGRDPTTSEEMNSEGYEQRWDEVQTAVGEYAANLFKSADEITKADSVEARPVKQMGRSGNLKNADLEERQANWDEKFGATHNADGTPTAETQAQFESTQPTPINQERGFFGRLIEGRVGNEIDEAKELGTTIMDAADRTLPMLGMSADKVEINTDSAVANDKEKTASQLAAGVGQSVAEGQKIQSTGVTPIQPNINVSVANAKTTFPQGSAELMMIMNNGSYYT